MKTIFCIITPELNKYDKIILEEDCLEHQNKFSLKHHQKPFKSLKIDCAFVHYFVRELSLSYFYRNCVIENLLNWKGPDLLMLVPTKKNLIDYNWNDRLNELVRERCEVDHALSWLSTLGGAFSALGDYFENCAETAGKISFHQLKLAMRIDDPNIQSRCRLYLSLSLIQKKKYRLASRIVRTEFQLARNQTVVDSRLVKMCKGIWSKLQYEHGLYRKNRVIKR
ncbi:unnamed protein product [Ceutorhynchus assimilis]|uniref:Uncharacterized protein n=1 Tax=Ceutorhynchus assimilis TaxID=467358 RepID=A0A9N9MQH2_9CUCU|nr:unnamed protein product [Ceutorhynchus assimilis]